MRSPRNLLCKKQIRRRVNICSQPLSAPEAFLASGMLNFPTLLGALPLKHRKNGRNCKFYVIDAKRSPHYYERMDVLIIIPESGVLMEAVGIADILQTANSLEGGDGRQYRIVTACARPDRTVQGSTGLQILCDHFLGDLDPHRGYDTILVTGGFRDNQEVQNAIISEWIALAAGRTRRICSACTGAFFLAKSGVLEGRRATTHWKRVGGLEQDYPGVKVERDAILVSDGNILTAGGVSAAFDLGLRLVELDMGRQRALQVARHLVLYLRNPGGQAQFAHEQPPVSELDPIRRVQTWIANNPDSDASVDRLADMAGMSSRNFARVFAKEVGMGPGRYVELVRLDTARRLLEDGAHRVEEVAELSGLRTSLRRVFLKRLGITPQQYKTRFSSGITA